MAFLGLLGPAVVLFANIGPLVARGRTPTLWLAHLDGAGIRGLRPQDTRRHTPRSSNTSFARSSASTTHGQSRYQPAWENTSEISFRLSPVSRA
jgi:hypothetical protein